MAALNSLPQSDRHNLEAGYGIYKLDVNGVTTPVWGVSLGFSCGLLAVTGPAHDQFDHLSKEDAKRLALLWTMATGVTNEQLEQDVVPLSKLLDLSKACDTALKKVDPNYAGHSWTKPLYIVQELVHRVKAKALNPSSSTPAYNLVLSGVTLTKKYWETANLVPPEKWKGTVSKVSSAMEQHPGISGAEFQAVVKVLMGLPPARAGEICSHVMMLTDSLQRLLKAVEACGVSTPQLELTMNEAAMTLKETHETLPDFVKDQ